MEEEKEVVTFNRETRESVYEAQNGFCKSCLNRLDDFHHRVSNSKANQRKYTLFLQSPFNCVGLCRGCHDSSEIYKYKITDKEARVYELYLRMLQGKGEE